MKGMKRIGRRKDKIDKIMVTFEGHRTYHVIMKVVSRYPSTDALQPKFQGQNVSHEIRQTKCRAVAADTTARKTKEISIGLNNYDQPPTQRLKKTVTRHLPPISITNAPSPAAVNTHI